MIATASPEGVERGSKRVVYSALIGGYEDVVFRPAPDVVGIDFILFTDSVGVEPGDGWQVVYVEPYFPTDSVRSARRLKLRGHPRLDIYDEILWIDNRVALNSRIGQLFEVLSSQRADIVIPFHSYRKTVHDEFSEVLASDYDDPSRVRDMYRVATSCSVLLERPLWTGLFVRRNSPDVNRFMNQWYEYVLLTSRRDQLSVNAALSMHALRVHPLDIENDSSIYHKWYDERGLNRKRAVQRWRPPSRSLIVRMGDTFRVTTIGRKLIRGLARIGIVWPVLPRAE